MAELSTHFTWEEAKCKCGCEYSRINPLLVHKLEYLRYLAGNKPVKIHSWCRCGVHNKKVGGMPDSQHLYGTAVDISVDGLSFDRLIKLVQMTGFDGIGKYRKQGFVHVDVRGYPASWEG